MTQSNKRETQAEDNKNTNEQTIEEQLKEAREEVLNIFKAKKPDRRATNNTRSSSNK